MKISADQLAKMVHGDVEGDGSVEVSSFDKIEEATPGSLAFLANPKYTHFLYTTHASAVLVRRDLELEKPVETTLIRVDDPYATIADLLRLIESTKPRPAGIEQPCYIADDACIAAECYVGAFSYIGASARIGIGSLIYPQSYIGPGVSIGEGCIIYPGVKIYQGCRIGNRCIIHSGAVIGADGFGFAPTPEGYEKIPQTGIVEIADDVEIGANTTIDRATFGSTRIGEGTKLDNLIQVAHNVSIGRNNVFASQAGVAGSTHIGDWNMVGGQVGIAGHLKIGNRNEIGAQSGLHRNIPDGQRIIGYPAVPVKEFARNTFYISKLSELFKKKQQQ